MLDPMMRRLIDPPLDAAGRWLAAAGVSANAVSWAGFGIGVGAMAALAFQSYWLALVLIVANRAADGLDGAVARHAGISDLGGYLDIVLDFLFYSGVVFGFAVCLLPDWIAWLAYGFGGLCWLTTGARIAAAMDAFKD